MVFGGKVDGEIIVETPRKDLFQKARLRSGNFLTVQKKRAVRTVATRLARPAPHLSASQTPITL